MQRRGKGIRGGERVWKASRRRRNGEEAIHTLLDARLLRLVDDELLQVLFLGVGHLGDVDVAAA